MNSYKERPSKPLQWLQDYFRAQSVQRERIQHHSQYQHEVRQQKDNEYYHRRLERQRKRNLRKRHKRRARFLYMPTSFFLCVGTSCLLMSTIPGIGKNTFFWKNKVLFVSVGAGSLLIGCIFLMVAEGVGHWLQTKKTNDEIIEEADRLELLDLNKQTPCKHQQRVWKRYALNGFKPLSVEQVQEAYHSDACALDEMPLRYNDKYDKKTYTVGFKKRGTEGTKSVEIQTDNELLMQYFENKREKTSFRVKRKLCKLDSGNSTCYSIVSAGTLMTDISDVTSEGEDLIDYEEQDLLSVSHPDNLSTARLFFTTMGPPLRPLPNGDHELEVIAEADNKGPQLWGPSIETEHVHEFSSVAAPSVGYQTCEEPAINVNYTYDTTNGVRGADDYDDDDDDDDGYKQPSNHQH